MSEESVVNECENPYCSCDPCECTEDDLCLCCISVPEQCQKLKLAGQPLGVKTFISFTITWIFNRCLVGWF